MLTMECPFCGKEMVKGVLSGDGRSRVRWEAKGEETGFLEKVLGKGMIDVEYSLSKFKIHSFYCPGCKKMIFDTDIHE